MELLSWPVVGALLGYLASERRGYSNVSGVLGGMLLGPFAVLMFLIDGIASGDEARVKCAHCAEWIRREAAVCRHCGRDVTPAPVQTQTVAPKYYGCPACGKTVTRGDASCRHCGVRLAPPG